MASDPVLTPAAAAALPGACSLGCPCVLSHFSPVQLFVTPQIVAVHGIFPGKNTGVGCRALLWGLPDPGIEPASLRSPALADGFFTSSTTWEALWGSHCQAKHCSVFSEEPLEGACLQRFVACFERKVTARQWCYKSSTSTAFSTAAHGKGAYKRLSSDAWSGDSSWECAIESLVLPLH